MNREEKNAFERNYKSEIYKFAKYTKKELCDIYNKAPLHININEWYVVKYLLLGDPYMPTEYADKILTVS